MEGPPSMGRQTQAGEMLGAKSTNQLGKLEIAGGKARAAQAGTTAAQRERHRLEWENQPETSVKEV